MRDIIENARNSRVTISRRFQRKSKTVRDCGVMWSHRGYRSRRKERDGTREGGGHTDNQSHSARSSIAREHSRPGHGLPGDRGAHSHRRGQNGAAVIASWENCGPKIAARSRNAWIMPLVGAASSVSNRPNGQSCVCRAFPLLDESCPMLA